MFLFGSKEYSYYDNYCCCRCCPLGCSWKAYELLRMLNYYYYCEDDYDEHDVSRGDEGEDDSDRLCCLFMECLSYFIVMQSNFRDDF